MEWSADDVMEINALMTTIAKNKEVVQRCNNDIALLFKEAVSRGRVYVTHIGEMITKEKQESFDAGKPLQKGRKKEYSAALKYIKKRSRRLNYLLRRVEKEGVPSFVKYPTITVTAPVVVDPETPVEVIAQAPVEVLAQTPVEVSTQTATEVTSASTN